MSNFNFFKSEIFNKLIRLRRYNSELFKFVRIVLWFLGIASLFFVIAHIFITFDVSRRLDGLGLIVISFWLVWIVYDLYGLQLSIEGYKNIKPKDESNLAEFLNLDTAGVVLDGYLFAHKKNAQVVDNFAIVWGLTQNKRMDFVFPRLGFFKEEITEALKKLNLNTGSQGLLKFSQEFTQSLQQAKSIAQKSGRIQITLYDLVLALFQLDAYFNKIVSYFHINEQDLSQVLRWEQKIWHRINEKRYFWESKNLIRHKGIGEDWAAGYTVNLDKYSRDLTTLIQESGMGLHIIGHNQDIEGIERILSRASKNNVLIIGDPGVGRKTTAYGFAKKVVDGKALGNLSHKHIKELDIGALLAGASQAGEIESRLEKCLGEAATAGNIILLIDDIHNLLGGGQGKVGAVDASEILIPFLNSSAIQLIGITTYDEYHRYIEPNSTVLGLFEKVEIKQPKEGSTLVILEDIIPKIESRYGVLFTYLAMKEAVTLSGRYIHDKPFPEKAIDLIEEVAVHAAQITHRKFIIPQDVEAIISTRAKIPVGEVKQEEKEKLLHLEEYLHTRVVDQEEAIKVISDAMRRARAGLAAGKRPIGVFLFLGPTGVGKTETSKALAQSYFGSITSMIRLDMSEYQEVSSIDRLIGVSTGQGEGGYLTKRVRDNPFSLILLDEIEKAHHDILNLFLQVFDEGRLTDNVGRTVDFTNTIIIATSNAGAELIRQSVSKNVPQAQLKDMLLDWLQKNNIFRPEFLNRFDAIVSFKPLTLDQIKQVAGLMLDEVNKTIKPKEIKVSVTPEALGKLVKLGYDPTMGARPMRRVIQEKVESVVARKILTGEAQRGSMVEIGIQDIEEGITK